MENHLQNNQISSLIDIDKEEAAALVAEKNDGDRLSLEMISKLSGIDLKHIRKYLYRGIIGSTKKSDVLAWLQHKEKNVITRLPRVRSERVFNKWR